jgi:N-acetylglucosamine-6-phosphate deacetylase
MAAGPLRRVCVRSPSPMDIFRLDLWICMFMAETEPIIWIGTVEAVRTANRAHLLHGTTSIFPTTTTGSPEQLERMIRSCAEIGERWSIVDGARIAGVHFYGPYFATDKVGCHSVIGRRDPSAEEYEKLFALGIIRIATCAAELPGAEAFYQAAQKLGCLLTCGHSDANWAEMQRAFDVAFVTLITFGAP